MSVTPKDAATAVSPDTFAGVMVTLDSTIDPSSLTTANVTLKTGTTATSATVTADGTKGFKVTLASKLAYDKPYTFTANVKDTLGRAITVSTSFATGAAPCQTNMIWKQELGQCVYQMGVKVFTANQVPLGCDHETEVCWTEFFSKGPDTGLKLIDTSAVMTGFNTRPLVFGFWKNNATLFGVTGLWKLLAIYVDTKKITAGSASDVGVSGSTDELDWVYSPRPNEGYLPGIIAHLKGSGLCYLMAWDDKQQAWDINGTGDGKPTTCPQ
nr:Ig-like domain-containing protein [uncultured Roseateles sp.]